MKDPEDVFNQLNMIGAKHNLIIQVCNATYIATWEHPFFSALQAMLAFSQQRNISNHLALEFLLYLSGQRQIKIAIKEFGMKSGNNVITILGNTENTMKIALSRVKEILGGNELDDIMNLSGNEKLNAVKEYFRIKDDEINAIIDSNSPVSYQHTICEIVLNRIALVTLEK
ncbi:MAG: KEOPS complex subunit Cgi121 [Candidatus Helarchaeota archaeon]